MIKCILFDMVGVLAKVREDSLTIEEQIVLEAKDKYQYDEDYYEYMQNELPNLSLEEIEELTYETTLKTLEPINQHIVNEIENLNEDIEIGIITNHISVAKLWFEEMFPNIYNIYTSGDLGLSKPSEYIFKYVAKDLGINEEDILFIDDDIKNVESAQEAGMKADIYNETMDLVELIKKYI